MVDLSIVMLVYQRVEPCFFLRGQCREMVIETTPSIVILVISYSPDWDYSTSIYINYTVAL